MSFENSLQSPSMINWLDPEIVNLYRILDFDMPLPSTDIVQLNGPAMPDSPISLPSSSTSFENIPLVITQTQSEHFDILYEVDSDGNMDEIDDYEENPIIVISDESDAGDGDISDDDDEDDDCKPPPPMNCQICLRSYVHRIPTVLAKCGHTFCYKCIKSYIKRTPRPLRRCAICRTPTKKKDMVKMFF